MVFLRLFLLTFKQSQHQSSSLWTDISEICWIFQHRKVLIHLWNGIRNQIIMFAGLIRQKDTALCCKLSRPHSGGIHDIVAFDFFSRFKQNTRNAAIFLLGSNSSNP